MNSFSMGHFQGNNNFVFIFYQISYASNDRLKDIFKVGYSYDKNNGKFSLKIDLTKTDPNFADSSVLGELSIWTIGQSNATYEIEF